MALVMTSLILVQTNSILKALEIKEEQFDAAVKSALNQVIIRLEMEETLKLNEHSKKLFAPRNTGVFPNNNLQRTNPGAVNQQNIQLSFQYSQRASGNIISEELTIGYGEPPIEKPIERGKPGDFPNAFDIIHDYDGYVSQQYENRMNRWAQMLQVTQIAVMLSSLPIEERIEAQTLGRLIKT